MVAVVVGCGGGKTPRVPTPEPAETAAATATAPAPVAHTDAPPEPIAAIQHKPESFLPAWTAVGVGQTVSFGTAAIDQDLDETAVAVDTMPASATFDPITQTITWTPTAADLQVGHGSFVLTVKQADTPGGTWTRTEQVTFDIAVGKRAQPAPVAAAQSALAETVLTIRDKARLATVNADWPFDKMLAHAADLVRATLPPEIQARLAPTDRDRAYTSLLRALAATHANPRLDPDSPDFDRAAFGRAADWKIVAIRPRIDKAWCELRIVYQATLAPEPVFAMLRLRPTWDSAALPPEARTINNAIMLQLVAKYLLGKDLGPNPKYVKQPKAEAKAIAALVKTLATYAPPAPKRGQVAAPPWQRAGLVAVWTEARMGGGSARGADGTYRSGDGWAWSVVKPMPTADASAQAYTTVVLPGVWTDAAKAPDGAGWIAACAPTPDASRCSKALGLVDLPAPATIDATNLHVDFKRAELIARLALDDGRRDDGEDSAMTCAQCHTRHFGVRDHVEPASANAAIATVEFQIVPSRTAPVWPQYLLALMQDQECRAKANLEAALGKTSALTCPLAPAP